MTTSIQCASKTKAIRSEDYMRPLKDIRKAVHYTFRNKIKRKSENNRTYYSVYHRPGMDLHLSAYKQKERAQLVMTILGDRRPYHVSVLYRVEKLNGKKYSLSRYDKSLAKQYLEKLETYLASRPEERDMIDDFRPY